MRRRADRLLAPAALGLLVATAAAAAPPDVAPDRPLVLAMFALPWDSYWTRPALRVAERYGATIELAWTLESLGETCVGFRVGDADDAAPLLEALRSDPRVTLAEPVQPFRTLSDGGWNDAYAGLQPSLDELGLAAAQRIATGRSVRVAIVDTGIDLSHPDLAGRVVEARSYVDGDPEGFTGDPHGTAIAGVVAAAANNGIGIVGVAPQAELIALKACWPDPPGSRSSACDTYTLARALDRAVLSDARILNLSLAGPEDPLLSRLLDRAEQEGKLVVAAADESGELTFPASHPTVLAVRSQGPDVASEPPDESSPGRSPEPVRAPGNDILTTGPDATYDFFSGSSLAAAHVTGLAALVLERAPTASPVRLRSILRSALGAGPGHAACAALASAMGLEVCPDGATGSAPLGDRDPL